MKDHDAFLAMSHMPHLMASIMTVVVMAMLGVSSAVYLLAGLVIAHVPQVVCQVCGRRLFLKSQNVLQSRVDGTRGELRSSGLVMMMGQL